MDVLNKILDEFDGALDNIAHHIAPFLNISLSSVSSQLTSIENATLHHSLSVLVLALGSSKYILLSLSIERDLERKLRVFLPPYTTPIGNLVGYLYSFRDEYRLS